MMGMGMTTPGMGMMAPGMTTPYQTSMIDPNQLRLMAQGSTPSQPNAALMAHLGGVPNGHVQ